MVLRKWLKSLLEEAIGNVEHIPDEPFSGILAGNNEAVDWAAIGCQKAVKW